MCERGRFELSIPRDSSEFTALARAVETYASALGLPGAPMIGRVVWLSADWELPIADVVQAFDALRGSSCRRQDEWNVEGGDPSRCLFVYRIFAASPPWPTPAP